jgi:hypothetical protein
VLRTEDAALNVQELLERDLGRVVVAQSTMAEAEVVEDAEGGRIVGSQRVAPPVVDALVHGPSVPRLIHERQGHGQAVNGRQGVEVARAQDALAAFHEDGVGVARREVLLELDRESRKPGLGLDRRRMVRPEELAPSLQHLPADRPL